MTGQHLELAAGGGLADAIVVLEDRVGAHGTAQLEVLLEIVR